MTKIAGGILIAVATLWVLWATATIMFYMDGNLACPPGSVMVPPVIAVVWLAEILAVGTIVMLFKAIKVWLV